jgi:hypothetical protein
MKKSRRPNNRHHLLYLAESLEERRLLSQVDFVASRAFETDSYPISVTAADFNGDGKAGLAVINTSFISILLNRTNFPPSAQPGGSYTIQQGDALSLNASTSTDPDSDPLTFSWDLNADGNFTGSAGPDSFYLKLSGDGSLLQVWDGSSASGDPSHSFDGHSLYSLCFSTGGGDDITLDCCNGSPFTASLKNLDLMTNHLTILNADLATINALVRSGYNNGQWTGPGRGLEPDAPDRSSDVVKPKGGP